MGKTTILSNFSRTARASLGIAILVAVLSVLFWAFGPVRQPGELGWNRLWIAGVGLLLACGVIFGIAMSFVWIAYDRNPIRRVGTDVAVLFASGGILVSVIAVCLQIDSGLYSAQLDIVQAICAEGFRDPVSLEKYGYDKLPIGGWEYVAIWEDESQNAIWIDSCNSLSACGVVCIRPGFTLAQSTQSLPATHFRLLREGLYTWD